MMSVNRSFILLSVVLSAGFGAVQAQEKSVSEQMAPLNYKETGKTFFGDRERGWHWYEDPVEEAARRKREAMQEKPPAPPAPVEAKAESKPAKPAGPAPMSSEWLKENMPKYAGRAIDNPTDENVKAYLYLQRFAMDKASNYATASERVTANDPYLDINVRKPVSQIGSDRAELEGGKLRMKILADLSKTTGMMFFFRGGCEFCHTQWPLVKWFSERYKFPVMPVSLDGSIMDGMDPKNVVRNRGQAEMMGVTVVPSMYLLQPPGKYAVVSHGVTAVESFPDLIMGAALQAGLIDERQYMGTRAINDISIKGGLDEGFTEELVADPVKLVEYMKKKLKEGR